MIESVYSSLLTRKKHKNFPHKNCFLGIISELWSVFKMPFGKDHPNIPIIIEHLEESDVPRDKQFLDERLMANGC